MMFSHMTDEFFLTFIMAKIKNSLKKPWARATANKFILFFITNKYLHYIYSEEPHPILEQTASFDTWSVCVCEYISETPWHEHITSNSHYMRSENCTSGSNATIISGGSVCVRVSVCVPSHGWCSEETADVQKKEERQRWSLRNEVRGSLSMSVCVCVCSQRVDDPSLRYQTQQHSDFFFNNTLASSGFQSSWIGSQLFSARLCQISHINWCV